MTSAREAYAPAFVANAVGHADLAPVVLRVDRHVEPGFGPLAPFIGETGVTDVLVTADGTVWVDRGHGVERANAPPLATEAARDLAVRLVALGARHVDEATPCVDVRLGDGIRVHVVLPPISRDGAVISVRVPRREMLSLADLGRAGMLTPAHDVQLRSLVASRQNLLVTGAAGTGKTTLLAALLALAPAHERIVVLEDVAELRIDHPHVVTLESRQANLEGAGRIGLDSLVREALRMRPDRLVVGECRGPELRELLAALNTGHDGGAGTLHANSLADVPARLEALGSLAGFDAVVLARQVVSAIDVVIHLDRTATGRRVSAIGRLGTDADGRLTVVPP